MLNDFTNPLLPTSENVGGGATLATFGAASPVVGSVDTAQAKSSQTDTKNTPENLSPGKPHHRGRWLLLLIALFLVWRGIAAVQAASTQPGRSLAARFISSLVFQGPPGVHGSPGPTGPSGQDGQPGQIGVSGATGSRGLSGANGAQGAQGSQGIQGIQGVAGSNDCIAGVCVSRQATSPGTAEAGNLNITGGVIAATLAGSGSGITNVDASYLSGFNAGYFTNASNISSGTLADARLSANATLQGNSFNGASQLVQLTAGGILPVLSGANLTNVNAATLQGNSSSYFTNASNISSGTLADARLSANVALLNATQTFIGAITLSAAGTALSVTNNVTIGGTLGVTGLSTLGSLSVTGSTTLASLSVTGNATVGSLTYGTSITSSCSGLTGYIWVPGSSKYGTLPGFCVMKYDASNDGSGNAVSVPNVLPWVSISQQTAETTASAVCSGCHLITDNEWMTIAENALWQNTNWCNSDGSLCNNAPGTTGKILASGHNDNSPAQALTASSDDTQACYGTVTAGVNTVCGSTTGTQKRTLTLSNGNIIWDIGGNVWQWTDSWILGNDQPMTATAGFAWNDYTAITQFKGLQYLNPTDMGWNSTQGLGQIYSENSTTNAIQYAFLRGGSWADGSDAGAFSLALSAAPTYTDNNFGFRVAR
ncbi:MAG TPA: hypothetical protein VNE40_03570 [Candidatus Dormibacteraeota bacterium]|nr:hypothetical protein [Candidatus Dormibacteraeota bacterium]